MTLLLWQKLSFPGRHVNAKAARSYNRRLLCRTGAIVQARRHCRAAVRTDPFHEATVRD
ncbi:protein of unknown function [Burkholderia multivorans]